MSGTSPMQVVQAGTLTDFSDKPLVIPTAGVASDAAHLVSQDHLATLSTNAVHEALVADRGPATATTRAILDVVTSAVTPAR
jgi:hypothetical protein